MKTSLAWTERDQIRISAESGVGKSTLMRWLKGGTITYLSMARIQTAATKLGIKIPEGFEKNVK